MIIQASLKVAPKSYKNREESYKLVDEALKIIRDSSLKYLIGPSETTVQGHRDEVLNLIKLIQDFYYENKIDFSIVVIFEYNRDNFYIDQKQENINKIVK